jgi:ABC-type transporter Mla subunit MlaD
MLAWLFRPVIELLERILMNQAELAQALTDLGAQLAKASAEITGKIADLETALANAGATTPEVDAAVASLKVSGQALDDIVPDAPPVP